MDNRKWVRRGFGSVALVAAGAGTWGLACSSDNNNPNLTGLDSGGGAPDTGAGSADTGASATDGTVGSESGSLADSAADTGSIDAGVPPLISLVHAAPDVPPVRFCFGLSPAGALGGTEAKPVAPSGLPFGAGGALAIAPSNAAIISSVDIYIWAVPASSINAANAASFADAGDAGQDYGACSAAVNLPGSMLFAMIPKGTVQYDHSYIVAMDGCQNPGIDGGAAICGVVTTEYPSGTALGNLRLEIVEVDNTTVVPANAIGAQFLHLSPSLQAILPAGVIPGITSPGEAGVDNDDGGDAAPPAPVYNYANITTTPVAYNGVYAGPPGSTVAEPTETFTGTTAAAANLETAGIGIRTASLAVPAPSLASISLDTVATATLGLADGGVPQTASALFMTGQSYTFVAIGNVGQTPATSSTFFRVIALPSVH